MAKGDHLSIDFLPVLADFVRLQHDDTRDRWVLQAPERVLVLDDTSKEIVDHFDGRTSLGEIIDSLVTEYDAPRDVIDHDVRAVVGLLEEKRFLRAEAEHGEE